MLFSDEEVAKQLIQGEVVAIPTDTVYGLAADLYSDQAIAKIYKLKKRPPQKSLILFLPDIQSLDKIPVEVSGDVIQFVNEFWPGNVTVILQLTEAALKSPFWKMRAASDGSIAIRVPKMIGTQQLMKKYKICLMTTSANIADQTPCRSVEEVEMQFGQEFPILNGDTVSEMDNVASTIVDCRTFPYRIIREGELVKSPRFLTYVEV